jgi:hypothetical protein
MAQSVIIARVTAVIAVVLAELNQVRINWYMYILFLFALNFTHKIRHEPPSIFIYAFRSWHQYDSFIALAVA